MSAIVTCRSNKNSIFGVKYKAFVRIFNLFYCFSMFFDEIYVKKYLLYFLLSLTTFAVAHSTIAQEYPAHFEGKYIYADSISGNATYQYRMEGGDTIKHGAFTFESIEERFEDNHSVEGISLQGYYHNNLKDGAWHYAHQRLALTGTATLRGSNIGYNANGTEFLVNAYFQKGKIHGDYEMVKRTVVQSNPADTLFYAKLQYVNGQTTGTFLGFTREMEVTGQFDDDGFPDGDWLFAHRSDSGKKMQELRRYDHGFFSKHFYKMDDGLVEIKHTGFDTVVRSGLGLLTHLQANPTYFRALDYTPIVMEHATIDKGQSILPLDTVQAYIVQANAFLERVFIEPAVYRGKDIWKEIGGSESVAPVKLKIRQFAFSPEESSFNQDNEKLLNETQSLIYTVIDNPNIEVTRFADQEVGFYYEVLEIYRKNLEQASPVVHFLADTASEYVDHNAILSHNVRQISYPQAVEYRYHDETQTREYTFPPELIATDTRVLHEHLKAVYSDVENIVKKLEGAVQDYEVQGELTQKERELISLRDTVIRLYNNTDSNDGYNALHESLRENVQYFMERSFADYAKQDGFQRVTKVDSMQNCYRYFLTTYEALIGYQETLEKLDREYTRRVWNPFTFTHMEERVKSRLYNAFENLLLPYIWEDIQANVSCVALPYKLRNVDRLLKRMIELRWQDTKEMERKIRRARNDVHTCLEILDLYVDIKDNPR